MGVEELKKMLSDVEKIELFIDGQMMGEDEKSDAVEAVRSL